MIFPRFLLSGLLGVCLLLPAMLRAADPLPPAAQVGSWKISLQELDALLAPQLYELDRKRHSLRIDRLQDLVADHLLGLEAKARNLPLEQFLKEEVEAKAAPVQDADVQRFMEGNKEILPEGVPNLDEKVRNLLRQQNMERVRGQLLAQLANKYQVKIALPAPPVPRIQVPGPYSEAKGPENAPVTIVEFSDFQCPFCRRAQPTLQAIEKAYGDKVRMVFRHYPLPSHTKAPKASEAALCAGEQQKFWEYHDALFQDPGYVESTDQLKALAGKLGLQGDSFDKCLDGGKYAKRVQEDLAVGQSLGITGTPTFFINGVMLVGAQPEGAFREVIDQELKRNGAGR